MKSLETNEGNSAGIFYGDRKDLIENNALKKMSLSLNSKFGLLACFCGSTLNLDNWIRHLRSHDKFSYLTTEERNEINQLIKCSEPKKIDNDHHEPIQGLTIFQGFQCSTCEAISSSSIGAKQHHYTSKHLGTPLITECYYQKIGKSNFKVISYFIYFI